MNRVSVTHWIEAEVVHMTDAAVLLQSTITGKQAWIPLSAIIDSDHEIEIGLILEVELGDAVATNKELI